MRRTNLIVRGALHAPYIIFVQCAGKYSDHELLQRFGLPTYARSERAQRFGPYAFLGDDGNWTLLADDWLYTLWHMTTTPPTIENLAEDHDIFACSTGDSDHSFDFLYFQDSQLVRKYVFDDPTCRGGSVVENFGKPLPGEADAFKHKDEKKIVLAIAQSLGIRTQYEEIDLRIYAPAESG